MLILIFIFTSEFTFDFHANKSYRNIFFAQTLKSCKFIQRKYVHTLLYSGYWIKIK